MDITGCTKADYDQIVAEVSAFWGHSRNRPLHHSMFIHEFRDCAFVVRDHSKVVAYLFGLIASAEPVAYIHLVAVRSSHRRHGLARQLYKHFTSVASARSCRQLKAITNPGNARSIRFHRALGFQLEGVPNAEGVPIVKDYGGPGVDRVVFRRDLQGAT